MARKTIRRRKRNPIIFIGVEGKNKTERAYLNNFSERNFRFKFSSTGDTDILGMAKELKTLMDNNDFNTGTGDRSFLVIDTDNSNSRIRAIKQCSSFCAENNIVLITSCPEFETWFLLHFMDCNIPNSKQEIIKKLEKNLKSNYTKTTDIYSKLKGLTGQAIANAKKLEKQPLQADNLLSSPHSKVYLILEYIKSITG